MVGVILATEADVVISNRQLLDCSFANLDWEVGVRTGYQLTTTSEMVRSTSIVRVRFHSKVGQLTN